MEKTKILIVLLVLLTLVCIFPYADAINAYIRPTRFILNINFTSNQINVVEDAVEIMNKDEFNVIVTLSAEGDIEDITEFEENEIVLVPNETRNAYFLIFLPNPGSYTGYITATYRKQEGWSYPFGLSADVLITASSAGEGVNNFPPGNFNLVLPEDGYTFHGESITLDWEESIDTDNNTVLYYYMIDNNSDFSSPEYLGKTLMTEKQLHLSLDGKLYYWKIIATDGVHNTSSNQAWTIVTQNQPPGTPELLTPESGAVIEGDIAFRWTNVTDPDGDTVNYTLYLDNESGFISPETITTINNSYTLNSSLLENSIYYWRVKAYDGYSQSNYSNTWNFTVNRTAPPNLCGNGIVDSGEQCDGSNLNGQTCVSRGYTGGTLSCSQTCTFVTTGCTSGGGGDGGGGGSSGGGGGGGGGGGSYTPPTTNASVAAQNNTTTVITPINVSTNQTIATENVTNQTESAGVPITGFAIGSIDTNLILIAVVVVIIIVAGLFLLKRLF